MSRLEHKDFPETTWLLWKAVSVKELPVLSNNDFIIVVFIR